MLVLISKFEITMKLFFMAVLVCGVSLCASAQGYRLNDTLYVWEMHGVDLVYNPAQPNDAANKYYYGSPARVVDTDIHRFPASMEVNEGFEMPGYWVKVIIRQDTGYVFDGFLSRLRPFDLRSDTRGMDLARTNFSGSAEVSKDIRAYSPATMSEGESREMAFDNGIDWTVKKVKPCIVEKYTLPDLRFAEVYQFMMAVYSNYFDQNANSMAEPEFVRLNGVRYEFILREDSGTQQITVFRQGKEWVINAFACD